MAGTWPEDGRYWRHGQRYEQRHAAAPGELRARMVDRIVAGGGLTDPAWRAAFAEVPRELFVLEEGEERTGRLLAGAYEDRPIATRVVGGELVSSSSQPSLMALMCQALEVHGGERVLEIGAGTGYNAALMAHRLGPGTVTTIDLEPEITAAARAHLDAYGTEAARSVEVVTGDGAFGHPPGAPYQRVMATCELPSVPPAWLEQCVPGGLVLLPLAAGLVALTVYGPGRAQGRFLDTPAYFVPLRGAVGAPAGAPEHGLAARVFGGGADRTRYGLTVDGTHQWIWRDRPDGPLTWPLTGG
ncbi:methyltransferase domain-containing protein [Actinacidiphila sp. bgisy145]|uniref:methyltransferase domain-containing protein n=1 Tax=Actinacidiphila sp. bgisy145 TaxID=3413792 RepID=UPI003EB92CF9